MRRDVYIRRDVRACKKVTAVEHYIGKCNILKKDIK